MILFRMEVAAIYKSSVKINMALQIKTTSFLHIGTGLGNQVVDRTVMKDKKGLLYIPASSIKGKLRNICEELTEIFDLKNCSPHGKKQCSRKPFCIVCRIFGSKFREGRLLFDNAYMSEESRKIYEDAGYLQTQARTQVKINRIIKTSEKGHLFQSEYGVRDITFQGEINGLLPATPLGAEEGNPPYEVIFLLSGLKMLKSIGGNKSTGSGEVDITIGYLGEDKFKKGFINLDNEEKDISELLEKIEEMNDYSAAVELMGGE